MRSLEIDQFMSWKRDFVSIQLCPAKVCLLVSLGNLVFSLSDAMDSGKMSVSMDL